MREILIEKFIPPTEFQDKHYYFWTDNRGQYHRYNDLPAVIVYEAHIIKYYWFIHGKAHRKGDKPSVIKTERNGDFNALLFRHDETFLEYYKHGVLHRDGDNPALFYNSGKKIWVKNGMLHREGDKPAVLSETHIGYYKNGMVHREGNQPAFIVNKSHSIYYRNNKIIKVEFDYGNKYFNFFMKNSITFGFILGSIFSIIALFFLKK